MANKNSPKGHGYIGAISNSGAQVVKAPLAQNGGKGKSVVHKGNDLRTGK